MVVDPQRVKFEAAALTKLFQIQPHCVPKVYLLDTKSNSSEDENCLFVSFSQKCQAQCYCIAFMNIPYTASCSVPLPMSFRT